MSKDWYTVKRLGGGSIKFSDFVRKHGIEVVVEERGADRKRYNLAQFYAHIPNGELKIGGILSGVFGNGEKIEKALCDLADKLAGGLLVLGAFSEDRREIECPTSWLPE